MSVSEIDLSIYGIENQKKIFHNLSYDELYEHETNPTLKGFEVVEKTALGAVNVDTGKFTGRSPKDKYIVKDEATEENVWWWRKDNRSDNKPISQEVWDELLETTQKQLSHKSLYVVDAFCGANKNSRLKIRVVTEVAWQAHFVKNMFIRPTEEELKDFTPDFVMLNSCKTINEKWKEQALNSEVYVAFNISKGMTIIGGTWYGGEMKKGFFSIMNYFLPLRGIASMHCSANQGIKEKDTALFFGLSGTGKTTLSTDPDRLLIGDDEHGWDDDGIFNFEGGCYAKCIDLSKEQEPDIYAAIRRDALLENVAIDKDGNPDFCCSEKTENTRVSYPIYHINNIVKPVSKGTHPKNIIFLTADAFGIFPPVSKLTKEQAMYYFLSGYTAKLAGTELGIKEPVPTFSPAFGAPFLLLHPTVYAQVLAEKMEEHGSNAFLVNTGYARGPYGIGKRMRLSTTRSIINAIHSGEINTCEYVKLQPFGLWIPTHLPSSKSELLNPRDTWDDKDFYDRKAIELAELFIDNFKKFRDNDIAKKIESAGPQL